MFAICQTLGPRPSAVVRRPQRAAPAACFTNNYLILNTCCELWNVVSCLQRDPSRRGVYISHSLLNGAQISEHAFWCGAALFKVLFIYEVVDIEYLLLFDHTLLKVACYRSNHRS